MRFDPRPHVDVRSLISHEHKCRCVIPLSACVDDFSDIWIGSRTQRLGCVLTRGYQENNEEEEEELPRTPSQKRSFSSDYFLLNHDMIAYFESTLDAENASSRGFELSAISGTSRTRTKQRWCSQAEAPGGPRRPPEAPGGRQPTEHQARGPFNGPRCDYIHFTLQPSDPLRCY